MKSLKVLSLIIGVLFLTNTACSKKNFSPTADSSSAQKTLRDAVDDGTNSPNGDIDDQIDDDDMVDCAQQPPQGSANVPVTSINRYIADQKSSLAQIACNETKEVKKHLDDKLGNCPSSPPASTTSVQHSSGQKCVRTCHDNADDSSSDDSSSDDDSKDSDSKDR
jgi:hypothetical protein